MARHLEERVQELVQAEVERFAAWCAKHWTITPDVFIKDNVFDGKPPGYRDGYNAALEALNDAVELWFEEGAP